MEYKHIVISCIERMPDTPECTDALRKIHDIAKRAGKEARFSPSARKRKWTRDIKEDVIACAVRDRLCR